MKKQLINEAFRFQRLAGIITENEYMEKNTSIYESSLSPEEKKVYDDIVNTLNESDNIIDKIKSYAKKGLITLGVLAALLGGPILSQNQKTQVVDTVRTEIALQGTEIEHYALAQSAAMTVQSPYLKDKVEKLAKEDPGVYFLVNELSKENYDKISNSDNSAHKLAAIGEVYKNACEKLINIY
jgi:hypothetical protein